MVCTPMFTLTPELNQHTGIKALYNSGACSNLYPLSLSNTRCEKLKGFVTFLKLTLLKAECDIWVIRFLSMLL